MVMKEQDDDLKNWMRGACRDAPLSENFTNQVMDLIALLPEPEILPLISTRIWRVLLFVMAGIFALVVLAGIDLKRLNTGQLDGFWGALDDHFIDNC
jgi:hypothetical protein